MCKWKPPFMFQVCLNSSKRPPLGHFSGLGLNTLMMWSAHGKIQSCKRPSQALEEIQGCLDRNFQGQGAWIKIEKRRNTGFGRQIPLVFWTFCPLGQSIAGRGQRSAFSNMDFREGILLFVSMVRTTPKYVSICPPFYISIALMKLKISPSVARISTLVPWLAFLYIHLPSPVSLSRCSQSNLSEA